MKKFLLLMVACLTIGGLNAQIAKKQALGKPHAQKQVVQQAKPQNIKVLGAKAGVKAVLDKTSKVFNGKMGKLTPMTPAFKQKNLRRAGSVLEKYEGSGTLRSTSAATEWEMLSGTVTSEDNTTSTVLKDVIPNIFGFEDGVVVEYTLEDGKIVIKPQLVASFESEEAPTGIYYLFLESANSKDGSITLTLADDGGITGSYSIIYSIYPAATYNYDDWVATYNGVANAQYNIPGVDKVPVVSFEPSNLVLFAGLGLNGYSYNNNIAMTGADATTGFSNLTTDKATAWAWTAWDASADEPTAYATGNERDFSVKTSYGEALHNVQLEATNNTVKADPFIFGVGKYKGDDGKDRYSDCYIYAGQTNSSFVLNNATPAIFTRQDPDGNLKFYADWATPDQASNEMTKIYMYHEKPAAPLYIEGITLPLVSFKAKDNFNLHIKICKASYPAGVTVPTIGDVIAEGDATSENINAEFDSGLTGIEIPLYVEDEFGMSTELDYLFLDEEFVIVIEGWNNGTFSGVLGSQDTPLDNARTSTWFEMKGKEGMYSYTSWKTSLFVGFLNATYGWLHTDDNTTMTIPAEGGQASIKVSPMFNNSDDAETKTRLWVDDTIEGNEIPEWLTFGFANENYTDTESSFDLVAQAEALPAGVEGRTATVTFMQEGARLTVTVNQGETSGISVTKTDVKSGNGQMYNLAGQRVNNGFKGLVIKNGRKFMNK